MKLPPRLPWLSRASLFEEVSAALGSTDLEVPLDFALLPLGGEAFLTQLIMTWGAHTAHGRVLLDDLKFFSLKSVEDINRPIFFAIALCGRRIVSKTTKKDITFEFIRKMSDLLEGISKISDISNKKARGPNFHFIVADKFGIIPDQSLYNEFSVRPVIEFRDLFWSVFDKIAPSSDLGDKYMESSFVESLSSAAYELFSNTHDHGRKNLNQDVINPSLRGLHVARHTMDIKGWSNVAGEFLPLSEFINRHAENSDRNLHIYEVTVFDSGIGMAEKWSNTILQDLSLEQEVNAVQDCFLEGNTSKRSARFGEGLPLVIQLLRERAGFVTLRTGRLSAYRDLYNERFRSQSEPVTLDYWDWGNKMGVAKARGTVVSILVPAKINRL